VSILESFLALSVFGLVVLRAESAGGLMGVNMDLKFCQDAILTPSIAPLEVDPEA
jgi:hypothetical protein